jgi:hypothetical protein
MTQNKNTSNREVTSIKVNTCTIRTFIKQIWPVLAFYVIGDISTTIWAMEHGAPELNATLAAAMDSIGYTALFIIKAISILCLFVGYRWYYISSPNTWKLWVGIFVALGVFLTANNMYQILVYVVYF